jgi:AcrR family transcriptional regulator
VDGGREVATPTGVATGPVPVKRTAPPGPPDGAAHWQHYEPLELSPILRAALEAFSEQGFHGTSVRDISARAGLQAPALYYYHQNKEGVLVALLEAGTQDLARRVDEAMADAGPDPVRRFANVVRIIVLHMAYRTRLASLDWELRHVSEPARKPYVARRKQIEVLVTTIVCDGVAAGEFRAEEPAETARAVLGMLQAITRWYQEGGPLRPEQLADRYVEIALRTVGHAQARSAPPADGG